MATRYGKVVGARKRRAAPKRRTAHPKRRRNPTKALPAARPRPSKPKKAKTTTKKSTAKKDPARVKAGKKAARTRRLSALKRSRAAKKAARSRKGTTRKPGRYRVKVKAARYGSRKAYLRRYPIRKAKKARAKSKSKKTVRASSKRRAAPRRKRPVFGRVWRAGYNYKHPATGKTVRVKGRYVKKGGVKKARKAAARKATKKAKAKTRTPQRYRVKVKAARYGSRKSYLRRYPKRGGKRRAAPRRKRPVFGRVWRAGYSYKHPKSGKIVRVKGRYVKKGGRKGARRYSPAGMPVPRSRALAALRTGTYVANPGGYGRSWIGRRHGSALGMASNPMALAMLPTMDQLKTVGKASAVVFAGFAGAAAVGKAMTQWVGLRQYTGVWTPVAGNILSGLAFWAAAHYMDNPKLNAMKPYVMMGAGLAAITNIIRNLVASNVIPSEYASWVMPGAQGAAVAVATEVPEAAATLSGLGQIDVYEAALDGVSGIESELEAEMNRLGAYNGGGGGGSNEGIFGAYETVPLGAEVEEAFSAYETVPLGAEVEELTAGFGAYETTSLPTLGAEVEQAFSSYETVPLGATVEQAFAGMGQANGNGNGAAWSEFEQSLKSAPLMPGFKAGIQQLVRKRIAAGMPMDDAFYSKLGRASAQLAERKIQQRMRSIQGQPGMAPQTEGWRPPVTNMATPKRKAMIPSDAAAAPGDAGGIMSVSEDQDFQGILEGSSLGIFD